VSLKKPPPTLANKPKKAVVEPGAYFVRRKDFVVGVQEKFTLLVLITPLLFTNYIDS
jgi:hypothetical protein